MIPAFVLLRMFQGVTFDTVVTLRSVNGDPVDLSTRTARMQVRTYRDGPVMLELTTENGRIELNDEGEIRFNVAAVDLAVIPVNYDYEQWVYDIELVQDDIVEKPFYGTVVFAPEITVTEP